MSATPKYADKKLVFARDHEALSSLLALALIARAVFFVLLV